MDYYTLKRRDPKMMVYDTEFGATYGSYRPAEEDTTYWRIAQYLCPFYSMPPTGILGVRMAVIAIVPVDDAHSMRWQISGPAGAMSRQFGKHRPGVRASPRRGVPAGPGRLAGQVAPRPRTRQTTT